MPGRLARSCCSSSAAATAAAGAGALDQSLHRAATQRTACHLGRIDRARRQPRQPHAHSQQPHLPVRARRAKRRPGQHVGRTCCERQRQPEPARRRRVAHHRVPTRTDVRALTQLQLRLAAWARAQVAHDAAAAAATAVPAIGLRAATDAAAARADTGEEFADLRDEHPGLLRRALEVAPEVLDGRGKHLQMRSVRKGRGGGRCACGLGRAALPCHRQ
eukprot:359697-Chlamydomonas_euryale.AAC.2